MIPILDNSLNHLVDSSVAASPCAGIQRTCSPQCTLLVLGALLVPYLMGLPGEDPALGTAASCLGEAQAAQMDHGGLGTGCCPWGALSGGSWGCVSDRGAVV